MSWPRALVLLACLVAAPLPAAADRLDVSEGAHICIIGGGVADAMQHTGWLETLFHSRFPDHRLVIRNLGYEGDEIDPAKRLRSADFGTPDEWLSGSAPIPRPADVADKNTVRTNRFELTGTRADIVFAFFGANESHAGPAGLAAFKAEVERFIKHTLAQKYNGVSAPKLVMFSPIAHEDLGRAHWPDGQAHTTNLAIYTAALEEVCQAHGVECVDLFTPTLEAYAKSPEHLTEDGIHPNLRGDRQISRIIDEALFGRHPARDEASLERLRQAVLDKNFYWFNRYRVTDGYSTYGGRAWLKFVDGQTNYEVGQRELEYLDVKTANRDRRIWATAATLADPAAPLPPVDDSSLPPLLGVTTNKPGPLAGGQHVFLSGAEAISRMTVHSGMKVELVADEGMFPELVNPVQMAFDTKGRLWVAAWLSYPHWRPDEGMNDKLLILEDDDGDGKADRAKTFAGDLHNPTGFEFWGKGVIVAQGPDVLYLEDTDGDDAYDVKRRIIRGLDTADTHHTANSFTLDPSGTLHFQEGTFHHSQPETPWGPPVRTANGAVFSYEPRTGKTGLYTSYSFANPHGHVFGRWGDDIVVDGTGSEPYWGSVFSSRLDGLNKHANAPRVYQQRTRPCPAIEILSSPHFPSKLQGNLLVGNVIGFQGILQYAFQPGADPAADSFPVAVEVEPLLSSSDPNFRPADIEVGPDGAVYFTDWQNPIIGHMQHNLRDPSRDRAHGRVYRVVMEGRPTERPVPIAGRPVAELVSLLADPTDRVRYRARIELAGRPETEVVPAVKAWLAGLDAADPEFEHRRLEALWTLRHFDQVEVQLLESVLMSADFRARAAGVRVLAAIADRVPGALDMVRQAAADAHPRVRLEAVRAATFLRVPEAIEPLAIATEFPSDRFMDYVKAEAARVLEPEFQAARAAGRPIAFTTPAGLELLYGSMTSEQFEAEPRSPAVYRAMLLRAGLDERLRAEAVEALAKAEQTSGVRVVADALADLDRRPGEVDSMAALAVVRVLLARPGAERAELGAALEKLATEARRPILRRIGYASLMTIDAASKSAGDASERAWAVAGGAPERLVDLFEALPLVEDAGVRAALRERIVAFLDRDPGVETAVPGRFVRLEMTGGMRTLWLAEVEAISGGANVASGCAARQKQPGEAAAAIDGRGDTVAAAKPDEDPWWELDLGGERLLERIVVRQADGLNKDRLKNFTLIMLDADRRETFRGEAKAAESLVTAVAVESAAARELAAARRAAFQALAGLRGHEADTFSLLARFIRAGRDRDAVIRAATTIPLAQWPAGEAAATLTPLLEWLRSATAADRSSDAGLAVWQFAERLTTLLPAAEGKVRREELAELGVRVVRIGTAYERMAYDTETVVVQAGRPVLFVLDNPDAMPHNFVITKPGRMQAVGELAEAKAQDPAFALASFVPQSPDVLAASTLMQPQATQKLTFQAPTEPGVYPYVCTYPGHWRRMFGALYVVDDLEGYLADPAAYLAAHPVAIQDELLKDRRPRTEWTLADLEASVAGMTSGRSFVHGRELFRTASCVACHKLGDEGNAFGPELAKLSREMTAVEITRHILEPSLRIDDKYRSTTIITDEGRALTGLVVEETPSEVAIVENPVAKSEPVRIPKAAIDERTTSPVSLMPKGLLDKLSRDEILDLVAYVAARGDDSNCLFNPEPCPHSGGGK